MPFTRNQDARAQTSAIAGRPIALMTNQFKLRLSQDLSVYQYDVSVSPDHMSDSYIMQGLFKLLKKQLDAILGLYVQSGRSVFTTTDLTESVSFNPSFRSIDYRVLIDVESKTFFSGKSMGKMEDHNVMHTLLNIIVKQAFRETNLRQIGRQPRFFDVSKAIEVEGSGL